MECVPTASDDVASDARPPLSAAAPMSADPLKNWTLPVAAAGATVAVNVVACPAFDGFMPDVSVVVVGTGVTAFETETVTTAEVLRLPAASRAIAVRV